MVAKNGLFTPFLKQCFVTTAVGCNIIGHGAAIGYPAVLLPQLQKPGSVMQLKDDAASWIASVLGITQLFGLLVTPLIMGRCGRKVAHLSVTLPGLLGWIITTIATNYQELLIGRILLGLSIGMLSPLRSALIGEYSSPKNRGALLTTVSLTQSLGIFIVHLIGSFLSWQQTALVIAFFPFISLIMTIYSPESPSWLADKERYEESIEVFRWLRGNNEEKELEEMIEARITQKMEQNSKITFKLLKSSITKKEFYKPITLMSHANVLFNFAGATAMASYSTVILGIVMGPTVNVNFWMIFLDTQRLLSNTIAVFFINRYKRRTMMNITGTLSIMSQLSIAIYAYFRTNGSFTYDAIWLPALLVNLQFFAIATGILPLPNVIGGEVFPIQYKSIGGSISQASLSATFFLVLKTFPALVNSVGLHGTYVIHTGILTYCMMIIWLLLPETKGKTLQEIENEFKGKHLLPKDFEAIPFSDNKTEHTEKFET